MALMYRLSYARVLVGIGELVEAELEVADMLEADPSNMAALSLLAKIKHIRGELSTAIGCWAQLHAKSPLNDNARMHLTSILNLAQDPEKGAGEFIALGQFQLVRKPAAYLALEEAFHLFVSRQPHEARAHCERVARKHDGRDRELYKLALLADAWISELSGDLETACETLESLGRQRGFETDLDRVTALVGLYERLGTREKLEAAANIYRFLERTTDPTPFLGRLALLYRRLDRPDDALKFEERHLEYFQRGMHHVSLVEAARVAAVQYIPLRDLAQIQIGSKKIDPEAPQRETAVAAALTGDYPKARELFGAGGETIDRKYLADIAADEGDLPQALELYCAALRDDVGDQRLANLLLDVQAQNPSRQIEEVFGVMHIAALTRNNLENLVQLAPRDARAWRRLAMATSLQRDELRFRQCIERAEALEAAASPRARPIGRVLAAGVYHFVGKAKGLIHEIWAGREPVIPGQGGGLPTENILGNLTQDMRDNVRNNFLGVREYARATFPHLTGDMLDYSYTFKVTKEDEPSGGTSAGLPTALAFLSVFLQKPIRPTVASSGILVADAHDVLVVKPVGDVELKVRAAYHRDLERIILPQANRVELEASALVPRVISAEIVTFVSNLDEAVRAAFGAEAFE